MRTAAQVNHAPVFDANQWMANSFAGQDLYHDDCHMLPAGNAYFAEHLCKAIAPQFPLAHAATQLNMRMGEGRLSTSRSVESQSGVRAVALKHP